MDYEQTALTYRNFGQEKKFQEKPDYTMYKKEQGWYEKVKSPRTGEFYQADDLIKRELVPGDWKPPHVDSEGNPVKYPIKHTNNIIRRRLADGSEWITSRQQWIGLDQLGNAINISMDDKECFDDVLPIRVQKPENPKDNPRFKDTKMILVVDRLERRIKYTEPFKPETVQQLYDMRNGNNGCTLTMIDESSSHPGVSIPKESYEAFKSGLFDEVWQWATTPRYKMEPSTTQENHKQYG
jgi:hypothetical protein